jgi:hypothetical protein
MIAVQTDTYHWGWNRPDYTAAELAGSWQASRTEVSPPKTGWALSDERQKDQRAQWVGCFIT